MTAPAPPARLAEATELALWPGVLIGENETASAELVLDAASTYVRLATGDPGRWPNEGDAPYAAKVLTIQVAARAWRNPSCATAVTVGPFTDQFAKAVDEAVYLTDAETRIAESLAARPRLWTQTTERDRDGDAPNYLDPFSGETIPASPYPSSDYLYDVA